jgi:hypothetical protein
MGTKQEQENKVAIINGMAYVSQPTPQKGNFSTNFNVPIDENKRKRRDS